MRKNILETRGVRRPTEDDEEVTKNEPAALYLYILIQKKFNWYAFHTDTRASIRTENFLRKVTKKPFLRNSFLNS